MSDSAGRGPGRGLDAQTLIAGAIEETGLDDFGPGDMDEALGRLTEALASEGALTELGGQIMKLRLETLLCNRLLIADVHKKHPDIAEEPIGAPDAPLFIIGLPRTGTTALSNLLAADPAIRSLRLWESSAPVPPPESATEHDDPRIADAAAGLEAMYSAFPKMRSLYFQTATGPTECQDLFGMAFRTAHFDGMAHVPSYVQWVLDCDMTPAYDMHRRTLQLLQWHCGPRRWHLKTPVHMLSLDALDAAYPDACFLWTHRDPGAVLGSVCSLVQYTRSWVGEPGDPVGLGAGQLHQWAEAIRRAMDFRARHGETRFADVSFDVLNADPVRAVDHAYARLGLELDGPRRDAVGAWARQHPPGSHGTHEYALEDFGLDRGAVGVAFEQYTERFDLTD
jgi:Sulfotransferase family